MHSFFQATLHSWQSRSDKQIFVSIFGVRSHTEADSFAAQEAPDKEDPTANEDWSNRKGY